MENAGASNLLHIAETVHWVALAFMGTAYTFRLLWMLKFKAGRDRQMPGEARGDTSLYPAFYSMANVAMPWVMESTRKDLLFWINFVVFHVGAVTGIFFAIISSAYRPFVEIPAISFIFLVTFAITFMVAIRRVIRRFTNPVLRLVSSPDDYFAILTLTVWFGLGILASGHVAGLLKSQMFMVIFLFVTSFFLIYVPFSKISHYLYYPFTRYYIGRTLGHRGSMPPAPSRS